MADKSTIGQTHYADVASALAEFTNRVLFDEVWARPGLSRRDKSIVTVSALVALYRINELPGHIKLALEHGVTREELTDLVTHLAFYSGWPTASSAVGILRKTLGEIPA
ncbi:carboxymuconolactone decarboxylase family protein [Rhodoplanes sp. SY1]|uniref:carboxymuconolactone decarboxylase family protein n=1 Tax=Rhodoplanes sp. SY1 TaxID=3166646 RepID=UPI0038B59C4D